MSFSDQVRKQFEHDLNDLKKMRDQLRAKLHLAGEAAQERWRELEPKIEEVERKIEAGSDELIGTTNQLFEEVGRAFRDFGNRLLDKDRASRRDDDSGASGD
ncbi:MAG: hypothetical protein Tsb0020_20200 [Haliangiales bacterium]